MPFLLNLISLCVLLNLANCGLVLNSVEVCNKKKVYKHDASHMVIKSEGDETIVNGYFEFKENIGEDTKGVVEMFLSRDGQKYIKIGVITAKDACKGLKKYVGETWLDILRAAHLMQPSSCPIPKGKYKLSNYHTNDKRMTLQGLPKGFLKAVMKIVNVRNNEEDLCVIVMGQSK